MSLDDLLTDGKMKLHIRGYSRSRIDDIFSGREMEMLQQRVMERIQEAMNEAIIGANSKLDTTAAEYINAIYIDASHYGSPVISIREEAKRLEEGYAPFDMLPGLLQSKNKKVSKDGNIYAVIPIGSKQAGPDVSSTKETDLELSIKAITLDGNKTLSQIVGEMHNRMNTDISVSGKINKEPESFRIASSSQTGTDKWKHPGFVGVQQLPMINNKLAADLEQMINDFINAYL